MLKLKIDGLTAPQLRLRTARGDPIASEISTRFHAQRRALRRLRRPGARHARAGFSHALMAERCFDAIETARHDVARRIEHVAHWPMRLSDVREIDWEPLRGQLALVSGGPPCQPFGIGGKKRGADHARDMCPEAVRAIREAAPEGFLFENVRNIAGPRFRPYLDWILASLSRPSLIRGPEEDHDRHLARRSASRGPPEYGLDGRGGLGVRAGQAWSG